ncbi:hypothetical protein L227DRAFT_577052 [Lentinus tigrinus ALCF2SS1-6]|uniref:Uncharacterized protein n=1 Tax=Lentinus tigrinus ALCF2SS1-6 TaxID=1328759 RepID=A0A5C2S6H3_9APHY|nr:hypothetical protein L227DRAFT_577052 [Lentinus tigrinus ALCF2SS1-6]
MSSFGWSAVESQSLVCPVLGQAWALGDLRPNQLPITPSAPHDNPMTQPFAAHAPSPAISLDRREQAWEVTKPWLSNPKEARGRLHRYTRRLASYMEDRSVLRAFR